MLIGQSFAFERTKRIMIIQNSLKLKKNVVQSVIDKYFWESKAHVDLLVRNFEPMINTSFKDNIPKLATT